MGIDGFSFLLHLIEMSCLPFLVLKENGQMIENIWLSHYQIHAIIFYFTWLFLSCSTKQGAGKEKKVCSCLNNRALNFKAKLRD